MIHDLLCIYGNAGEKSVVFSGLIEGWNGEAAPAISYCVLYPGWFY
jgi:hypothetical protein